MKRNDDGFTLVELLVAIVIIGIIMVPLSNVFIGFLRTDGTASARMDESHDAQIGATYWAQDVASIGIRQAYDSTAKTFPLAQSVNIPFPCSTPAGSSTVVVLGWDELDPSGASTSVRVAYVTSGSALIRLRCASGTLQSTATLAHDLDSASTPSVVCAGSGGSSCTGSGAAVPQKITLTFSVKDSSGKGQPYTLALAGQRRQS